MTTKNKARIVVGIPVRNGEDHIDAALQSLVDQTYTDFKILISDNNSSDRTEEICRNFERLDNRITYKRRKANTGALANFSSLIAETECEYFMFVAHDDTVGPGFIEMAAGELDQDAGLVAVCIAPYDRPSVTSIHLGYIGLEESTATERINSFVTLMADGNSRFYSLYRLPVLKDIDLSRADCLAGDWIIIVEILKKGRMRVVYNKDNGYVKTRQIDNETRRDFKKIHLRDVLFRNPFEAFTQSLPLSIRANRRSKLIFMWMRFAFRVLKYKLGKLELE